MTSAQEQEAMPVTDDASLKAFIRESRTVLDQLTVAVKAQLTSVMMEMAERELARVESRRVRGAYLLWRERYKVIEGEDDKNELEAEMRRQTAFAEQVSYVFFVRLLLTRVLEDKGIMPRLVSDGGFAAWYEFLKGYGIENVEEIGGESFLPIVYRRVSTFYRHFFLQPVFA